MTCRKKHEQENQNKPKIAADKGFVCSVVFKNLVIYKDNHRQID